MSSRYTTISGWHCCCLSHRKRSGNKMVFCAISLGHPFRPGEWGESKPSTSNIRFTWGSICQSLVVGRGDRSYWLRTATEILSIRWLSVVSFALLERLTYRPSLRLRYFVETLSDLRLFSLLLPDAILLSDCSISATSLYQIAQNRARRWKHLRIQRSTLITWTKKSRKKVSNLFIEPPMLTTCISNSFATNHMKLFRILIRRTFGRIECVAWRHLPPRDLLCLQNSLNKGHAYPFIRLYHKRSRDGDRDVSIFTSC